MIINLNFAIQILKPFEYYKMNYPFSYRRLILLLSISLCSFSAIAQNVALRTNALYWATTTPNAGLDIRLGQRTSFTLQAGYNPFEFPSKTLSNGDIVPRKFKHWLVMPELEYWFCQTYERHYLSVQGILGQYNVGGMLTDDLNAHRYKGEAYGVGLNWGYQWAIGRRWGLETSIGAGYIYLPYDKYECVSCGDHVGRYARNYFGPTKLELSFVYFLN